MKYKYIDEKKEHLHTLEGKPLIGCSTAVGIISKPLTYWASGMAVSTLGWTATKSDPDMRLEVATVALQAIKELDGTKWLKRLDLAYKAHATRLKEAAGDGVDLHFLLETYVKSCIEENAGVPFAHSVDETEQVSAFVDWSLENIEHFLYSEAHCYSEKLWTGGIFDALAVLKDGKTALFDFKSSKEAYYNQYVQAGGYAEMVRENGILTKDGEKLGDATIDALYIVPFGGDCIPKPQYDIEGFGKNFVSAVQLYKGQNNFN